MILKILKNFIKLNKTLNQIALFIPELCTPKIHLLPIEFYQDMCRVYLDEYKKDSNCFLEKAEDIVDKYEHWEEKSCWCHIGNPPCGKCENTPNDEDYNRALKVIESYDENELEKWPDIEMLNESDVGDKK